jgi:ubiquinone/menaquinone biosynthesis C-methylase UbiE
MPSKGDPAGFEKVDQAVDPKYFIEFLDARKTIEGEREIKQQILDLMELRLGAHVLDIGCGTGDDAREIVGLVGASGRVVGVDASDKMVAEAKQRAASCTLSLEFRAGDARKLDFPDCSFDAVRTDRVLIFVPEIEQTLTEIFRILRSGGRLVTSEIDWESWFVDSPMPETSRQVFAAIASDIRNSSLGRELLRLVTQAGFRKVKSIPQVVRPPYEWFHRLFDQRVRSSAERRGVPESDVTRWLEGLAQAQTAGVFNLGVTIFTAYGEKP